MINVTDYIACFPSFLLQDADPTPWQIVKSIDFIIKRALQTLGDDYSIKNDVAVHRSAKVEKTATIKGPAIIGANAYIGSHALLRGGVYIGEKVTVGASCEIKTTILLAGSAVAHYNFIGDSLIGEGVNVEAGAISANHFNERTDKNIFVLSEGKVIATGVQKFGALVGDGCRVGANAVLSPGTLLKPGTIVKRLELIEQLPSG